MQTRKTMYTYGKLRSSRSKLTRLSHKLRNSNIELRLHHCKVFVLAPAAIIQNCLGSSSHSTTHLPILFGSAFILQHYDNAMLHNRFCELSCCHVLPFVDVLLLSRYVLSFLIFLG